MKKTLQSVALLAVLFVAWQAYNIFDKASNFDKTIGMVSKLEKLCFLRKKDGKTTSTTQERPCPIIEQLAITHPDYQGYSVIPSRKRPLSAAALPG